MTLLLSAVLGLVVGSIGTRASMVMARAWGILDPPGDLKVHVEPTPRLGGVGIVTGCMLALLLSTTTMSTWRRSISTLAGGLVVAVTGVVDDVRGLRPFHKLLGELSGAVVFVFLSYADAGGMSATTPRVMSYGVAVVLLICFMSNSVNLLDGMDGLAAGTTVIASLFLGALALVEEEMDIAALFSSLMGACSGFLLFNLPPARTFMGDSGSLFLGYSMAVGALYLALQRPPFLARALGVILILQVPVADTCFAIARRLAHRRGILSGDRLHLYDGIYQWQKRNPWRTLAIVWSIAAICGVLGVCAFLSNVSVAILAAAGTVTGMLGLARAVGSLPGALAHRGRGLP